MDNGIDPAEVETAADLRVLAVVLRRVLDAEYRMVLGLPLLVVAG